MRGRRLTDRERWLREKPEDDFQAEVLKTAGWLGWLRFHDHDARRDNQESGVDPGFPDCFLIHPQQRRMVVLELKTETGTLSGGQLRWLGAFMLFPWVEVYSGLRPRDMDRIISILQGKERS